MHNNGDVVTYTEGGKAYKAFVFGMNTSILSHLGKNGEPMLHLAVFDEDPKHLALRMQPRVPIRLEYDVVHNTQSFTEAYYKEHGKETAAQHKGNGVWSDTSPQPAPSKAEAATPEKPASWGKK